MAYVKPEVDFPDIDEVEPRAASLDSTGFGGYFGRDSSSAMPALDTGVRPYEPAFIETDFTCPLMSVKRDRNVASAPPSSVPVPGSQRFVTHQPIRISNRALANSGTDEQCRNHVDMTRGLRAGFSGITNLPPSYDRSVKVLPANTTLCASGSDNPFGLSSGCLADELVRSQRPGAVTRVLSTSRSGVLAVMPDKLLKPVRPAFSDPRLLAGQRGFISRQSLSPHGLLQFQTRQNFSSRTRTRFERIPPKPLYHTVFAPTWTVGDTKGRNSLPDVKDFSSVARPLTMADSKSGNTTSTVKELSGHSIQRHAVNLECNSLRVQPTGHRFPLDPEHGQPNFVHRKVLQGCNDSQCVGQLLSAAAETKLPAVGCKVESASAYDCSKNSQTSNIELSSSFEPNDDGLSRTKNKVGDENVVQDGSVLEALGSTGDVGNDILSNFSSQPGSCLSDVAPESIASKSDSGLCGDKTGDCDYRGDSVEWRNCMDGTYAKSCMSALSLTAEGECEEEREFVWDDYLEETKASAAPPTFFKHVEYSLQNGFEKGMRLEVANKTPEDTYWIASILMTCGQLLRLRPEGCGEDGSLDFWCDILSSEVHQLGWCRENSKVLCPSEELKQRLPLVEWETVLDNSLKNARTPPLYMLDRRTGPLPIDQIKEGMFLEVQLDLEPDHAWPVKVIENVGGRLLLRYEALEAASDDFWLFYLHHRLHPIGWCRVHDIRYQPPSVVLAKKDDFDWSKYLELNLETFQKNQPPAEIFQDQMKIQKHGFVEGWKLEALHPGTLSTIHPASVKHIINEYFFTVELILPDSRELIRICCHSGSLNIFPVGWCSENDVTLFAAEFDWDKYLGEHAAEPAPKELFAASVVDKDLHGFESGMKLEAVNPCHPGQVCVATIRKVADGVMWLHLDHNPLSVLDHIVPVDTFDIFPIGWCESNNYPLKTPKIASSRRLAIIQSERHLEDEARNALYMQMKEADLKKSSGWCPKIYFNYRCFTGRYLSKGRLVLLPRSVGPGSVVLVMTTVLSKLISVAYKSSRVLRELQLKGKPNPNMHPQLLRAKYKGKSYSATVEICTSSDQINSFCRDVCRRLECCPNLISPHSYNTLCPENCSRLTKGRYPYYFGQKKRKIGRPPGGHTNLDIGPKKRGKRRKHRKLLLTLRKKHGLVGRVASPGDDEELDSNSTGSWKCSLENDDGSRDSRESFQRVSRKRKEPRTTTDIQTRGIRLPKYSFERRTHKKVLHLTQASNIKNSDYDPVQIPTTEEILKLTSNPLHWTVQEVVEYIKTTDCASIARLFKEQEIDGQSLLLLSLPTVQEHLEPKLGPAVKLCHQIERLKVTFYQQFAT